jgi:hypothetical protein
LGEAIVELEDEGGAGEGTQRHRGIAFFQTPECAAADEESFGHVHRGDSSAPTGKGEVMPELAQGADHGQGQWGHCRHGHSVSEKDQKTQ